MAKRTSLATVDLKGAGKPAKADKAPKTENGEVDLQAQTLRLPRRYWEDARVVAAMRRTTRVGVVQLALDEFLEQRLSERERSALGR